MQKNASKLANKQTKTSKTGDEDDGEVSTHAQTTVCCCALRALMSTLRFRALCTLTQFGVSFGVSSGSSMGGEACNGAAKEREREIDRALLST